MYLWHVTEIDNYLWFVDGKKIAYDDLTFPGRSAYATGCIGCWHLLLHWPVPLIASWHGSLWGATICHQHRKYNHAKAFTNLEHSHFDRTYNIYSGLIMNNCRLVKCVTSGWLKDILLTKPAQKSSRVFKSCPDIWISNPCRLEDLWCLRS